MFSIALWMEDHWVTMENLSSLQFPVTFKAIPKIHGKSDVKFVCRDLSEDRAYKIVQ